jgi:hypothetical protein
MFRINSADDLTNTVLLKRLIRSGEGPHIEFKDQEIHPRHLARAISAFANSEGGVVLLGITDNGEIRGMDNSSMLGPLVDRAVASLNPADISVETQIASIDGKNVGCIFVLPYGDTPIQSADSKFYRRIGAQTHRFSAEELDIVISKREQSTVLSLGESAIEKFVSSVDEETLTKILLVPLLRSLGFKCVNAKGHRDKTLEYGQDIRGFKYQLPTGHWMYFAAQVKTGNILYSAVKPSQNIQQILTQVAMAFEKKMFDAQEARHHVPDNVFFVASGEIVEGARQYLNERLSAQENKRILFWDKGLIIETCVEKGLPQGMQLEIERYLEESDQDLD